MYDDNNNNSRPHAGTTPPDHLLDELTSIKDLLGGERAAGLRPEDIPVLDDVVATARPSVDDLSTPAMHLLDIDRIFADDATTSVPDLPFPFPKFTLDVALSDAPEPAAALSDAPTTNSVAETLRLDYRRELLIQELVDDFLPRIEAELRERLDRFDAAALQALLKGD